MEVVPLKGCVGRGVTATQQAKSPAAPAAPPSGSSGAHATPPTFSSSSGRSATTTPTAPQGWRPISQRGHREREERWTMQDVKGRVWMAV